MTTEATTSSPSARSASIARKPRSVTVADLIEEIAIRDVMIAELRAENQDLQSILRKILAHSSVDVTHSSVDASTSALYSLRVLRHNANSAVG